MAKLSDSEKNDFLEFSRSPQLRHDMRMLKMNRGGFIKNIDLYIRFLNETNEMINHQPKKFKEIKGKFFLL